MILGIDPGQKGAFLLLSGSGKIVDMSVMPLGPDGQPDYLGIKNILKEMKKAEPNVYLERAVAMAMGSTHALTYGMGFAALKIALLELGLSYTMVEPGKWQSLIFQGIDKRFKPKVRALIAVDRLFPDEKGKIPVSPKAKNLHEGIVDALLIAEYGRRQISHLTT